MSRTPCVLMTGAGGEMGHGLIERMNRAGQTNIITLDVNPLSPALAKLVRKEVPGSILDKQLLERIHSEFEVDTVFHLAALLSTRSEFSPALAHSVNVEGTLNLLEFAQKEGESHGRRVTFFYPSSIAAYGLPDAATKAAANRVPEDLFNIPTTMYGVNKLYCEHLGRYYDRNYKQLSADPQAGKIDFRCIRFPGLISADTVPSGGTSDYAPEMLHAAASGKPYACFVEPEARIPFMAMPDAVDAILKLVNALKASLSRVVYNISAFAPRADEVEAIVRRAYPKAEITYQLDAKRAAIVRSWPADVDDTAARTDWGLNPKYDLTNAFADYLLPAITKRYVST